MTKRKNALREVSWLFEKAREFSFHDYADIAKQCAAKAKQVIEEAYPDGITKILVSRKK